MKKILILTIVFTMLFTINVFAEPLVYDGDIPQIVYDYAETHVDGDYMIFWDFQSDRWWIVFSTVPGRYQYVDDDTTPGVDFFDIEGNPTVISSYVSNDSMEFTYSAKSMSSGLGKYYQLAYSTFNVLYEDGSVFFSAPKVPVLTQATQAVGMKSLAEMKHLAPIMAIMTVGLGAFYKGWTLLKTTLSGA